MLSHWTLNRTKFWSFSRLQSVLPHYGFHIPWAPLLSSPCRSTVESLGSEPFTGPPGLMMENPWDSLTRSEVFSVARTIFCCPLSFKKFSLWLHHSSSLRTAARHRDPLLCLPLCTSRHCELRGHAACAVARGSVLRSPPCLLEFFAVAIMKFLILFEPWSSHFHFVLGPANYGADPAYQNSSNLWSSTRGSLEEKRR